MPERLALALAAAAALLIPLVLSDYAMSLVDSILVSALVVLGLVLLTGATGLTSLGQAGFVGIGAYMSGWLTTAYGVSPWAALPASLLASAAAAALVGFAALRMSGHFVALATLASGLSFFYLFGNAGFLGSYNGLTGIPAPTIAGIALSSDRAMYWLIAPILALAMWGVHNLLSSRTGRALRALRNGIVLAESMGADTTRLKLAAFVFAGTLAGLAGWLYAHLQGVINPSPFGVEPGIEYLFMAVIGGVSSVWGAVVGAATFTLLNRWLQGALPDLLGQGGNFTTPIFGLLMLLVLQRAQAGLWPALARLLRLRATRRMVTPHAMPRRAAAQPGAAVLDVHAARRTFGGLVAVDDVGFAVADGEIVGLLGPNGAGKSTLFNLISGVLPPSGGEITILGRRSETLGSRAVATLGVSRSFQHVRLVPEMSVLENVALGATLRGRRGMIAAACRLDAQEERTLLAEAAYQLDRVGMLDAADQPAGDLSLGRQRLLEIARALAADPRLLLLDEPAAGLRRPEKKELSALLRRLRDDMAILVVEHDMEFMMETADRLVAMQHGRKIAEGLPLDVQRDAQVRVAYLGA